MKKERVGEVSLEECEKLKAIYFRKTALEELLLSMESIEKNKEIYERIILDIVECKSKMNQWWSEISSAHNWGYDSDSRWEVQFNTQEVFLYI